MNQLVVQNNEFSNQVANTGIETASTAVAAQAKAMVEARYIMAIRRPRDMDVVRERMLKECRRPSFAAVARYVKPIGKDKTKWPSGPSIRFAEAAVRNMTNITVETMTVYDDREKRIVRVTVTDLEANVPYAQDITITKTIERRQRKDGDTVLRTRTNSYGDTVYILEATDDDIINKQQALISKAVRTLGLRLIPGDIVDECMDIVMETQDRADAEDPDAAKRKLFDAFGAVGVRAEQLKEYLGHDAATLDPRELKDLRALYAAIRVGEATWREVMDAKSGGDGKKNQPNATTLKDITEKAAAKKAANKQARDQKPDQFDQPQAPAVDDIIVEINKAVDPDVLDLAMDGFRSDAETISAEEMQRIEEAYQARREELLGA
jgi:hypothetical protein